VILVAFGTCGPGPEGMDGELNGSGQAIRPSTLLMAPTTFLVDHRRAACCRSLAGHSGFALLEILIGGVFIAIAVISMALMVSRGQSDVVADGDERVAVALARQKIEAVRSLGFNCIPLSSGTGDPTKDALKGCPGYNGIPDPPAVPDTTEAVAARTFNDTPPGPAGARYTSRITTVLCADPSTLQKVACASPPNPDAKLIRVELTPRMSQARAIRAETIVTRH
jgi:type II secretory pathway pseudopilin PulG